jgi:hypothetical protein
MEGLSIFKKIWASLKIRKKLWLLPLIIILVLFTLLFIFNRGFEIGSFSYPLF